MAHSWNGNTSGYSRDIAYDYAEGTAAAWDRKMDQEDEDTLRDEEASPNVYKPEDGHEYTPSEWMISEGRCAKCGRVEAIHVQPA